MKDLLDQIYNEIRSAIRFRWHGMLVLWIGCIGGWSWVAWMPNVYEGNARVYVDTSSILEPVLGNQIIAANVATQLAYIREALLGREQLERVATEVGLDLGIENPQRREAVLSALRQSIEIDSAGLNRNSNDSIYTISYRHSQREKAVGVVTAILDTFVEDTLGANRLEGDTAERFLDQQVEEYDVRLSQAEEALANFRKENADRLPGAEGTYFQRLQAERAALEQAYRELRVLESQRSQLEEQLSGQRSVIAGVTDGEYEPPPNSIDARIRDYEIQLDTLLLEYTERHPDVIAVRERLEILREQRAAQLADLGVENVDQEIAALSENPVYRTLQAAITETDVEIATQRANIDDREGRVAELQALIDEVPEVEAQLARLNRDYEVVYEQYLALVRSRETQDLTRKASNTDQVDFRVIDPPSAPLEPVAPQRPLLLSLVFLVSLGAGVGLSVLFAQIFPIFATIKSVHEHLGVPVLGVVAHAFQQRRRLARRKAIAAFCGVLAIVSLAFGVLMGLEIFGSGVHNLVLGQFAG